ncbi:hypothetical protein [Hymenobacter chitinivorans]|uniref:DUF1795 domain-containing protein n=1 Tax=Hymenobacter chitinivorans DSM 11115 TaxID=1121954 RepID=A0A2M9BRN2_9BACT|nr:hypothetical protein [Hymenobacter chitinivorans]PJJ60616.1 hypothetical protein CLV45_2045 [Hymenobacter chitinivorans DSM 11115]
MKALYALLLLLLTSVAAVGQAAPPAVNFCGQDYPLPPGATLVSPYEVKADKFDLMLMYLNPADLRNGAPADYTKQHMKKLKAKDLQEVACFIQGVPAKAFKYSYPTEAGSAYELLAYGVTKGQPVMIQLTLDVDPYNNIEIPEFARQFVHFDK